MLQRLREGLAWRWRQAARLRYLRRTFRNGEALAESYLRRTSCETAVCRDGTVIRHPPGRTGLAGMILEVWFDEVYTGRFYTPRAGDAIIDAGANIGLLSMLVARSNPNCQVLAFEPFEENFRLLRENLAAANASTVRACQLALAGESGEAAIIDGGPRSQDHHLTVRSAVNSDHSTIRTCSLADVIAMTPGETVALFKCDIEGSEYDLFAGATPEQLRRVQRFAIEYHDNIRPGTLELLRHRLSPSHIITVRPAPEGGYGMLYAVARPA